MKINPSLLRNIYKANTPAENHGEKAAVGAPASGGAKTDTVSISRQGAGLRDVGRISQTIAREITQEPSAQRIEQLRSAVQKGEYHVSTEHLADAILGVYA